MTRQHLVMKELIPPPLALPPLGMGCAPLGELFSRLSNAQATATLQAAWDAGIRYFDTSPFYGHGKSEHRVGAFLRDRERSEFMISTKVGRLYKATADRGFDPSPWLGGLPFQATFDYTYDGIMRSWEDSLQRLGLSRVDALLIHDLDPEFHDAARLDRCWRDLADSGFAALDELRSCGAIRAAGAGINLPGLIPRFLTEFDLDLFLVAMPYTLLSQATLAEDFPLCEKAGARVVIGAVFASGILVTGAVDGARYGYQDAPAGIVEKTRRIQSICDAFAVPLPAAALQFPLAHPQVTSVIPGALDPSHIHGHVAHLAHAIPGEFWVRLKEEGLLDASAPVPDTGKSSIDHGSDCP